VELAGKNVVYDPELDVESDDDTKKSGAGAKSGSTQPGPDDNGESQLREQALRSLLVKKLSK